MKTGKWDEYLIQRLKEDPQLRHVYLKECFMDSDPKTALTALSYIARAQGLSEQALADETGLTKMAINKIFNDGNPRWSSVFSIMQALGYNLSPTKKAKVRAQSNINSGLDGVKKQKTAKKA